MSIRKRVLYSLALCILCLAVLEVLAGIYVRASGLDKKLQYIQKILGHYDQFTLYQKDADTGYALRSASHNRVFTSEFDVDYSTNSDGLRDRQTDPKKAPGEFRILALGESNVFGQGIGYGKRFTEVMEDALARVNVINMGIPGFGMDQSFLQLQRDGFQYNPDVVVVFIMKDYLRRCRYYEFFPGLKPRFFVNEKGDGLILETVESARERAAHDGVKKENPPAGRVYKGSFADKINLWILFDFCRHRVTIEHMRKEKDKEYYSRLFRRVVQYKRGATAAGSQQFDTLVFLIMKKYKDLCAAHQTPLLVVNMEPVAVQNAAGACKALDIPYLDLSGALVRASKAHALQFEIDPHYNEFTHRLIGESVSGYLQNKYALEKK